jgi:hypothetical protein
VESDDETMTGPEPIGPDAIGPDPVRPPDPTPVDSLVPWVRVAPAGGFNPGAVLRELRQTRRRQRLADIHWVDAAYRVYMVGLFALVVVLFASSAIGDERLTATQLGRIDDHGAAAVGLVAGLAVAFGLRSGSRGGPLAMEAAEVRHVLLAPVGRRDALWGAALRQARYAAFVGAVVGAAAGQLASKRFHGQALAWAGAGAAFALLVALLFVGVAMVASGKRLHRAVATGLAMAMLAWAVGDVAKGVWSPMRSFGALALWPRTFDALGLLAPVVVVVLVLSGVAVLGGLSLEAAERRTGLVGQMRFAVTVQDLRTVIVLRRQLAQDLPRARPWRSTARSTRRFVVARRDLRSLYRFPAGRLARLVALAALAGWLLRVAWQGNSAVIVLAGVCLYIAALDVVEPLAQQVDQLDRTELLPVDQGVLLARHLPVPAVAMSILGVVVWGTAMGFERRVDALGIGALMVPSAVLCALAGALASVVAGAPSGASEAQLLPPEVAGMRIAARAAWPLLVSTLGCLPVVIGARAFRHGDPVAGPVAATAAAVLIPVVATVLWVRYRADVKVWFRDMMEQGQQAQRDRTRTAPTGAR